MRLEDPLWPHSARLYWNLKGAPVGRGAVRVQGVRCLSKRPPVNTQVTITGLDSRPSPQM